MIIFVDEENRIKAVDKSNNPDLTPFEIIDDEENPFMGMSNALICSHRAIVEDGRVVMWTAYRASSSLDYIDEIGREADENADKAEAFDILIGGADV